MPTGQLFIKGAGNNSAWHDAYTTWGVSMDSLALSTLMTPPELKEWVANESELENGDRVVSQTPRVKSRTISLGINMIATSENDFLSKYASFCSLLAGGLVYIRTSFQPSVQYKCLYVSCTSFSEYRLGLAKFILKLYEPNPSDRSYTA